ncbi:MAG: divalent metal cation transporter [Gammaproteobacteria bacterium]|nr:divalent metal cation transporter [Gammaproteobacteria bacterium]MCH9743362.1 divalent metal cation transporter [Gammaproteobacteria bacterium]
MDTSVPVNTENTGQLKRSLLLTFLMVIGPGLVVMLADTDAGSIIIAAQSGAVWGYRLLLLQFILMPILFIAQELTVRLGVVTRMGHGELIKKQFGTFWAWVSITTLIVCCIGAIISEFSGIAGVGNLFGIPPWLSVSLSIAFLSIIAFTGSYKSVERIAIGLGLFELVFFYVAWRAHPGAHAMLHGLVNMPMANPKYLYLMAANIGAIIMPWMIFYQQSAVVDKGLGKQHLKHARWDTAIGAVITQLIMAAVLVTTASTLGKTNPGVSLNTVEEISRALTPFLGRNAGEILFAIGMIGASMVAAIVVSLTAAWGLGEITGYKRSLSHRPRNAPWFYLVYLAVLLVGAFFVLSGLNIIQLNVAIGVMNALLLPIVLGFLYLLARKSLPEAFKLKGTYRIIVAAVLIVTSVFAVMGGLFGS